MTADLQLFTFEHGAQVRTVMIDGEPWFVAADLAKILGYRDASNAVRNLRDAWKGAHEMSTPGGLQELTIVSEPGVYRLIMRSNLPAAERFQDWLAEEVIPQIRKTGRYGVQKELSRVEFAEMLLESEKAREKERVDRLLAEAQNKALAAGRREDAPKVFAYHALMDSSGTVSVAEAAQIINVPGIGQNNFFKLLRDQEIIIPGKTRPYQQYIDRGWFVMRAGRGKPTTDSWEQVHTTRVTPKGLEALAKIFKTSSE